jgi:hypothetical protein
VDVWRYRHKTWLGLKFFILTNEFKYFFEGARKDCVADPRILSGKRKGECGKGAGMRGKKAQDRARQGDKESGEKKITDVEW